MWAKDHPSLPPATCPSGPISQAMAYAKLPPIGKIPLHFPLLSGGEALGAGDPTPLFCSRNVVVTTSFRPRSRAPYGSGNPRRVSTRGSPPPEGFHYHLELELRTVLTPPLLFISTPFSPGRGYT